MMVFTGTDVYWGFVYPLSNSDHDQVKQYGGTSQCLAQRDQFGTEFGNNSLHLKRDGTKLFSNNTQPTASSIKPVSK